MIPQFKQNNAQSFAVCPSCHDEGGTFSIKIHNGIESYKCKRCSLGELIATFANQGPHAEDKKSDIPIDQDANFENSLVYLNELWNVALPLEGKPIHMSVYGCATGAKIIPDSVRSLPYYWDKTNEIFRPAMLYKVTDMLGDLKALHLILLPSGNYRKRSQITLGNPTGCSVHLGPFKEALFICGEIHQALEVFNESGVTTWATLSSSEVDDLTLPPLPFGRLIIIAETPCKNKFGQSIISESLVNRWRNEGRHVCAITIPEDSIPFEN